MSKSQPNPSPRWIRPVAIVYIVVVLAIGLWVSLATGEWLALLCAFGLIVVPIGGRAYLLSKTR